MADGVVKVVIEGEQTVAPAATAAKDALGDLKQSEAQGQAGIKELGAETEKTTEKFITNRREVRAVGNELSETFGLGRLGGLMVGGVFAAIVAVTESIKVLISTWALDDVTSNIEVGFKNPDGSTSLILPQIIAVMDSASRKWVGWSISNDKAPNAGLVCGAALNAFRKSNIPKQIWVENGWVFGRSLLVNGKQDDQGRTIVTGLAQYGCTVHHFGKMNPQAKAELERSFEAIQRLMERHPGYTGRHQMMDAPDEFKREQRLINSGKVEATKFRYTFEEFRDEVMPELISKYNSTPQHGHLKGLSPNEAFIALADPNDPPIEYDPKLEWIFSNEKSIITVETGGVRFQHRTSGREIRVRGGRLVNLAGQELWAFVEREDPSMVTFMNLDFADPFTMEVCRTPSARQSSMAPSSDDLGIEIGKIREHERAVDDEYKRLIEGYGNPRRELRPQSLMECAGSR